MPDDHLDFLIRNYRDLTPAQRMLVHERVIERAKNMRAQILREFLHRLAAWFLYRSAMNRLGALDDRLLKDLGLHRSGIEGAVRDGRPNRSASKSKLDGAPPRPCFPQMPHLWLQRTG